MSHLVEPGVKYFLHESLKQCHELKKEYYNLYYNIGGFLFLVGLITIILWVKYKGKLSPIEKKLKSSKINYEKKSTKKINGCNIIDIITRQDPQNIQQFNTITNLKEVCNGK